MSNRSSRILGLDILRSIAILCVIACHVVQTSAPDSCIKTLVVQSLAVYGVELFFVLSGFLIGSILIRDIHERGASMATLKNFWIRRWYRTLPNYYFYLLISYFMLKPWRTGISMHPSYLLFLQNFAWPTPQFFVVAWSLSVEEWFYLIFPLLRVLAARVRNLIFGSR